MDIDTLLCGLGYPPSSEIEPFVVFDLKNRHLLDAIARAAPVRDVTHTNIGCCLLTAGVSPGKTITCPAAIPEIGIATNISSITMIMKS